MQASGSPRAMGAPSKIALSPSENKPPSIGEVLAKAQATALRGGLSGAAAMVINVMALMWMRTTVNFQYKYGMTTTQALRHLHKEGGGGLKGILRFYRGLGPALLQGPLSRFGDTAANEGAMAIMNNHPSFIGLPTAVKSLTASAAAAGFRVFLMPIDCLKTTLQVEGQKGMALLGTKIRTSGPLVLWHGWEGAITATFVGHYPWFYTRNQLSAVLPQYDRNTETLKYLGVNAFIGFCSSAVSDTCSNSIRVLKTTKQTADVSITYMQAFNQVVSKDGIQGLLFRGLGTKIISNGFQGLLFNVLWKVIMDSMPSK